MSQYGLEVKIDGNSIAAKVTRPDLDTQAAQSVCDQLSQLARESGTSRLRLDLGRVGFLNAAALGKLVALHVGLRNLGGTLTLLNVRLPVYEVFQMARLTKLLDVRRAGGKTVLVVEDDAPTRDALRAVLELEGYGVQCAADGQEALDNLRHEERPALILLDLHMGGMDGWQFRDEQRKDGALAPIPVVVVSGTYDVSGSAQSLGAAGYLQKPVELAHLLDALRHASVQPGGCTGHSGAACR